MRASLAVWIRHSVGAHSTPVKGASVPVSDRLLVIILVSASPDRAQMQAKKK